MVKTSEISPRFAHVADKVLPPVPKDQQILYLEPQYIVIGNFTTEQDLRSNKISNVKTGLNAVSFFAVIQNFCRRYDLVVDNFFQDSAVIRGTQENFQSVKQELGDRFSYAFTDQEQLEYMLSEEKKWALENHEQSPRTIVHDSLALDS